MSKNRLEEFSDGLFTIIITVMIFNLQVPLVGSWHGIVNFEWLSRLTAYAVSFVIIASFWVSHNLIMAPLEKVDNAILWTNALTFFPMSLLPIATTWYGGFMNHVAPSIMYGLIYVLSLMSLFVLSEVIAKRTENSVQKQMRRVNRGRAWLILAGLFSILFAFIWPPITEIMVFLVSGGWLVSRQMRLFNYSKKN